MPKKRAPEPPPSDPELLVSPAEAAAKIDERIEKGEELRARDVKTVDQLEENEAEYRRWSSYNEELLKRLFTTSKYADEYSWWGAVAISRYEQSPQQKLDDLRSEITEKIHRLQSIRDRLELIPLAPGVIRSTPAPEARVPTNRVFVVHGHDEAVRESVARFLERLGIEAVILHERATEGRTIVEKLEHYADVDFAVVLLTPDDIGSAKIEGAEKLQPRARQNVLLELGYFIGKLGRKHVCALYVGPLELPSDYLGVGYVALEPGGGWRLHLARELRAAGFPVDMNLAL